MNKALALSVLDQLPVFDGSTPAAAVREGIELAVAAEEWGYRRFWIAEHHGDSSRACASPAVLSAAVAARTQVIRIGAGCILLPYANSLRVAEDFRMLLALAPGRVDLGVGNGLGVTPAAQEALKGANVGNPLAYARQVQELVGLLAGRPNTNAPLAVPAVGETPELWVMASGLRGALVAATLGLPLSLAHFIGGDSACAAAAAYREAFRPSAEFPLPRLSFAVRITCAASHDEAEALGHCFWAPASGGMYRSTISQKGSAYPSLDDVRGHVVSAEELRFRSDNQHLNIVGTVEEVVTQLNDLATRYATDEVTVTTTCPDLPSRLRMYQLLAEHS